MKKKINFMIPGTSKAGTTSIHNYLRQHSNIFLPSVKETHFFDNDTLYVKGCSWYYDTFFSNSKGNKAIGEITPGYLRKSDVVIDRIKACCSENIKFIIILRDPVERAFSHYQHMKRNGKEKRSFRAALLHEDESVSKGWYTYYTEGLYGEHLEKWLKSFKKEQFLIIDYNQFSDHPDVVIERIISFLGLENETINTDKKYNMQSTVRSKLINKIINRPSGLSKAIYRSTIGFFITRDIKEKIRSWIKQRNLNQKKDREVLDHREAKKLRARYVSDIEKLEKLTNMKFSHWKP